MTQTPGENVCLIAALFVNPENVCCFVDKDCALRPLLLIPPCLA